MGAVESFVYFTGAVLTIFAAFYFSFSMTRKTVAQKLFIVHLLALGLYVILKPLGGVFKIHSHYVLYFRMFLYEAISAPFLVLAVWSMWKKPSKRVVFPLVSIAVVLSVLFALFYHKMSFNHFNLLDTTRVPGVNKTWRMYNKLARTTQILAAMFYPLAAVLALWIRNKLKVNLRKQLLLTVFGALAFFVGITYAVSCEKWMWTYYGALINAFFISCGVWLNARYMNRKLTRVMPLLQMECAAYLTRFRHPADKLTTLLQIMEKQGLPDRAIVIRVVHEKELSEKSLKDSQAEIINNCVNECFGDESVVTSTAADEFTVVVNSESVGIHNESDAMNFIEKLYDRLRECGIDAGVGCGFKKGFENLRESYQEASKALDYSSSLSLAVAVHIKDMPHLEEKELYPYSLKNSLLKEVELGNHTSAKRLLEELLPLIKELSAVHENVLRIRLHELVIAMVETGIVSGGDSAALNKLNESFFQAVNSASEEALTKEVFTTLEEVCRLINQRRETYVDSTINRAKDYIDEHFAKDISVSDVAEAVGLSSSHFMAVIKKYTGGTFSDYLRDVRITEAKCLIKESQLNMTEIAQAVGIPNSAYFSVQFKKVEGVSPSQFKKVNQSTYQKA